MAKKDYFLENKKLECYVFESETSPREIFYQSLLEQLKVAKNELLNASRNFVANLNKEMKERLQWLQNDFDQMIEKHVQQLRQKANNKQFTKDQNAAHETVFYLRELTKLYLEEFLDTKELEDFKVILMWLTEAPYKMKNNVELAFEDMMDKRDDKRQMKTMGIVYHQ